MEFFDILDIQNLDPDIQVFGDQYMKKIKNTVYCWYNDGTPRYKVTKTTLDYHYPNGALKFTKEIMRDEKRDETILINYKSWYKNGNVEKVYNNKNQYLLRENGKMWMRACRLTIQYWDEEGNESFDPLNNDYIEAYNNFRKLY